MRCCVRAFKLVSALPLQLDTVKVDSMQSELLLFAATQ